MIGRADAAPDQAARIRKNLPPKDIKMAEKLLQDYRTYLFPLEIQ
ncbi:MAG: hypothetical protein QNK92_06600 [Amylibacter sp.]